MAFQISPGINITEIDRTGVLNLIVSQTSAAYAGNFKWGPVDQIATVNSENDLVAKYGSPDDTNFLDFFSAANYMGYGARIQLIRAGSSTARAASAGGGGVTGNLVWNDSVYNVLTNDGVSAASGITGVACAKTIGSFGNSLRISYSDSISKGVTFTQLAPGGGLNGITWSGQSVTIGVTGNDFTAQFAKISVGDELKFGSSSYQFAVTAKSAGVPNTVTLLVTGSTANANAGISGATSATVEWGYASYLPYTPNTSAAASGKGYFNDEIAFVVIDEDGLFTGTPGQVVETYIGSKASNATLRDGSNNFYALKIGQSNYVRWISHAAGTDLSATGKEWGTSFNALGSTASGDTAGFKTLKANVYASLAGGTDVTPSEADILRAYAVLENTEDAEANLLLQGGNSINVGKYLVDLAELRKDAIAVLSPPLSAVKDVTSAQAYENLITYRNATLDKDSSYGVLDSGWKYQYDKYADTYRWLPLNPDVAGLMVRTDSTASPWFSPAGYNRGVIRNVVKLAFNPTKDQRDGLYTNGINPVITQSGTGTLLFGDKTLLKKPSAFDRINVRRLFITLEKAVATAAKFQLFEFNDEFTRANFVGLVEPFLREVLANRGITDYKIICDETNNTADVIDRNQFVADIYIKPTRTINYIQLNFVAVRSNVDFNEVGANVTF